MNSILSSLFGGGSKVENLDSETFAEKIKNDPEAVLIDVRTPEENRQIRIPNSVLMNIADRNFVDKLDKLDRSKSYYLYCRSGSRSYHACKQMSKMNFEKVFNLATGLIGWYGPTESSNT